MNRITKRDIVRNLLSNIGNNITAKNVDVAIPILNWTSEKILLSYAEKIRQQLFIRSNKNHGKPRFVKRWTIYEANLGKNIGSEQNGTSRPVLVLQNQSFNTDSSTVLVVPLTDALDINGNPKKLMRTHVEIDIPGLTKKSIIKIEHLKSISKNRLKGKICSIEDISKRQEIEGKLKMLLGIN